MATAVAYLTQAMADLARQLAFAPIPAARKHVANALALVGEIDPDQSYPMGFVTFRITGFRVDRGPDDLVQGAAIRSDLCTFVLEVSRRAPTTPDHSTGAVVTMTELAQRWSVSDRTLRRWRRFGLVLEWFERSGAEPASACVSRLPMVCNFIMRESSPVPGSFGVLPRTNDARSLRPLHAKPGAQRRSRKRSAPLPPRTASHPRRSG